MRRKTLHWIPIVEQSAPPIPVPRPPKPPVPPVEIETTIPADAIIYNPDTNEPTINPKYHKPLSASKPLPPGKKVTPHSPSKLSVQELNPVVNTTDPNADLRAKMDSDDPNVAAKAKLEQMRRDRAEVEMRRASAKDSAMNREPVMPSELRRESYQNQRRNSMINERLYAILETVKAIMEAKGGSQSHTHTEYPTHKELRPDPNDPRIKYGKQKPVSPARKNNDFTPNANRSKYGQK